MLLERETLYEKTSGKFLVINAPADDIFEAGTFRGRGGGRRVGGGVKGDFVVNIFRLMG